MKVLLTNRVLVIKDNLDLITDIGELRAVEEYAMRLRLKIQDNYFDSLAGNRCLFK